MVIEVQVLDVEVVIAVMEILVENTETALLKIFLHKLSHNIFIILVLSSSYRRRITNL